MKKYNHHTLPLTKQLDRLNANQLKELQHVLLNASITYELNGDYKSIFRKAKNTHVGYLKRLYGFLETSSIEIMQGLSKDLSDPVSNNPPFKLK